MNISVSMPYARQNLSKLVSKVNKHIDRVIVKVKGQPKTVLISTKRLESLEETIEVLSIPRALENIKKGQEQIKNGEFVLLSDLK